MPLGSGFCARELAVANRREVLASQTCAKSTAAAGAANRAGALGVLRAPQTIALGTAAAGAASIAGAGSVLLKGATYYCRGHGGGRLCKQSGCTRSTQGTTDYCTGHGGGRRCQQSGCGKGAGGTTDYCIGHGGGRLCKQSGCTRSARSGTDFCIGHGERCKGRRFNIDGTSEPCTRAGLLDKVAGSLLCAAHAEHGLVPASEARALIRTALGRSTPLPPDLSLWNCLGATADWAS